MKKIVMMLFALLLVGGGGAGAYFYFNKPAEAAIDPKDLEKGAKKELSDKEKTEADAKVSFVKMDPLTLPVVGKNGVVQIINISVTLEVSNPEVAKEIEKFTPRLKDAYIQDMYGSLSNNTAMDVSGVVEVNKIKARLNKITTKIIGPDKVNDVLLQAVQQRKS